jgi:hypothetical protein
MLGLGRKPLDGILSSPFWRPVDTHRSIYLARLDSLLFFDLVFARFDLMQIYWMITCIQPLMRIFAYLWRWPGRPRRLQSLLHRREDQSPYVSETPRFPVSEVLFATKISFTNKCEGKSREWRNVGKSKTACFQKFGLKAMTPSVQKC